MRIRVEQAFDLFPVKCTIIRKPLEIRLTTSSILLGTCARLHNFIIDTDWLENEEVTSADIVGNLNEIYRPSLTRFCSQPGTSFLQDMIVNHIEEKGYQCPYHNHLRNDDSSTTTLLNFEEYETMQLM
jgi:hypothetical protein